MQSVGGSKQILSTEGRVSPEIEWLGSCTSAAPKAVQNKTVTVYFHTYSAWREHGARQRISFELSLDDAKALRDSLDKSIFVREGIHSDTSVVVLHSY